MYKGQIFYTNHSVKMIRENLMELLSLLFLSLVGVSWEQSDSCSYQGQEVTGEFSIPGVCLLYRCIPGQGVTALGCGIRIPPDGCFIKHPESKNFPECCNTRVVCPEANSINPEQTQQASDSSRENLGYSRVGFGLPPSPFTGSTSGVFTSTQQKFSTPPSPDGAVPVFRPKSTKKRPNSGLTEPSNIYNLPRDETIGSGPYFYKK